MKNQIQSSRKIKLKKKKKEAKICREAGFDEI
jgi:hypothetical protein